MDVGRFPLHKSTTCLQRSRLFPVELEVSNNGRPILIFSDSLSVSNFPLLLPGHCYKVGPVAISDVKRVKVEIGMEELALGKEVSLASTPVLFKVWSLDLQHQHHLKTYYKSKPTESEILGLSAAVCVLTDNSETAKVWDQFLS